MLDKLVFHVSHLLDIIRDIDGKDGDLVAVIDEEGLDDTKNYSEDFQSIGERLYDFYKKNNTFFQSEISRLDEVASDFIGTDSVTWSLVTSTYEIERKNKRLISIIESLGCDIDKDEISSFYLIGKSFFELNGTDSSYLNNELNMLCDYVLELITNNEALYESCEEELHDLLFGTYDEDYQITKERFLDNLRNQNGNIHSENIIKSCRQVETNADEDLFEITDPTIWHAISDNSVSCTISRNRGTLNGVSIPKRFYSYFGIDVSNQKDREVELLYKTKAYGCLLTISKDDSFLNWKSDFRKRLIKKFPDIFVWYETTKKTVVKQVVIFFEKPELNKNHTYKVSFSTTEVDAKNRIKSE